MFAGVFASIPRMGMRVHLREMMEHSHPGSEEMSRNQAPISIRDATAMSL